MHVIFLFRPRCMELEEMLFCCLPGELLVLKITSESSEMEGNKNSGQISLYSNKPREESFSRGWTETERERRTLRWGGRNGKLKEDDPDGRGKKYCALLPPN